MSKRFLLLLVSLGSTLVAQNQITYIYDELRRLTGVIDTSGNAAKYTYDAVGNLLSISRYASNQVSVIQFTPDRGIAGTAVTIYGTGFSANTAQDTVQFNGVTATITSATTNQIVTSVPAGATTGPISVTSPSGSASSSNSYTVASNVTTVVRSQNLVYPDE